MVSTMFIVALQKVLLCVFVCMCFRQEREGGREIDRGRRVDQLLLYLFIYTS